MDERDADRQGRRPHPRMGCFPFGVVEYSALARFVKENQQPHVRKQRRRPYGSFRHDNRDKIYQKDVTRYTKEN
jgi:hypothetical protein